MKQPQTAALQATKRVGAGTENEPGLKSPNGWAQAGEGIKGWNKAFNFFISMFGIIIVLLRRY